MCEEKEQENVDVLDFMMKCKFDTKGSGVYLGLMARALHSHV